VLLCYPVTISEPDRAGIYHAGLAGAARRQFLGEFHREEPVKRRRSGGEQAPMNRERAVTRYQGDVRVNRPRPEALHVPLIGTCSQAYLRRYWFWWTEWCLSNKIIAYQCACKKNDSSEHRRIHLFNDLNFIFIQEQYQKLRMNEDSFLFLFGRRVYKIVCTHRLLPVTKVFALFSDSSSRNAADDARSRRHVSNSRTPRSRRNK